LLLIVTGLIFWLISKLTLGGAFRLLSNPKILVTQGICSKFRNLVYLGLCFTFICWVLIIQHSLFYALAIIIIMSSLLRVILEEKELEKKFGITCKKI